MPLSHVIAVVSIRAWSRLGSHLPSGGLVGGSRNASHLWRILAATLVVSAPNLWYVFAIVDLIQSPHPRPNRMVYCDAFVGLALPGAFRQEILDRCGGVVSPVANPDPDGHRDMIRTQSSWRGRAVFLRPQISRLAGLDWSGQPEHHTHAEGTKARRVIPTFGEAERGSMSEPVMPRGLPHRRATHPLDRSPRPMEILAVGRDGGADGGLIYQLRSQGRLVVRLRATVSLVGQHLESAQLSAPDRPVQLHAHAPRHGALRAGRVGLPTITIRVAALARRVSKPCGRLLKYDS